MNQPPYQPYPPQHGGGQQPPHGWAPQPQPPKKNTGKIIGFSCLGIVGLFVFIGIIGAVLSSGTDDTSSASDKADTSQEEPAKDSKDDKPKEEKPKQPETPVKVTAKKTAFAKSVLAESSDYTSVTVTITNSSDKTIKVNPLYFTITDTDGTKHTAELGMDENQIDTVDLSPGENVSGAITGKGSFTPKYVTYTEGLLGGDPLRADVS